MLDAVQQERKKIVIPKRGKPVASLIPADEEPHVIFGRLKGTGRIVGDVFSTGESWEADAQSSPGSIHPADLSRK